MFNGGPTLNGFTLFMERIRNLRQELAERNFEISSVSVKFSVDDRVKSFYGSDLRTIFLPACWIMVIRNSHDYSSVITVLSGVRAILLKNKHESALTMSFEMEFFTSIGLNETGIN